MKIEKYDLHDKNSLSSKQLQELSDYANYLRVREQKIEALVHLISHYIRIGKITDTQQIDEARAWFEHSNLSVTEIIDKIMEEEERK